MQSTNDQTIQKILSSRANRIAVAKGSHRWFFGIYLPHYVTHPMAEMHHEMFRITEDDENKLAVVIAFRGSGKSTIMTLSFPLWAVLGRPQKKFVLIVSQTQPQAKNILINLRREIESNHTLRNDFGALEEETDQWASSSIVIPKLNARIMAASTDTSIRGIRNWQYRPDLIICDDIEDLNAVRTREGRSKAYQWFTSEIIPAGDLSTRLIVIGNMLHEESLPMRLKRRIDDGLMEGVTRMYPLVDDNNICAWPGKFPDTAAVEKLRLSIGSDASWQREYLLRPVQDEDPVVPRAWIRYHKKIPDSTEKFRYRETIIGVDLAISQKESADYFAVVVADVYGYGSEMRLFVHANPINDRLSFPQQVERLKAVYKSHERRKLYIEDTGYQRAIIEQLKIEGIHAEPMSAGTMDKRARLALGSPLLQRGQVLFPEHGCEQLLDQITGFGSERHDDLADAFSIVLRAAAENPGHDGPMVIVSGGTPWRGPDGESHEPIDWNNLVL